MFRAAQVFPYSTEEINNANTTLVQQRYIFISQTQHFHGKNTVFTIPRTKNTVLI